MQWFPIIFDQGTAEKHFWGSVFRNLVKILYYCLIFKNIVLIFKALLGVKLLMNNQSLLKLFWESHDVPRSENHSSVTCTFREKEHEAPWGDVFIPTVSRAVLVDENVYYKVIWAIYGSGKDVKMKCYIKEELNTFLSENSTG